MAVPGEYHFAKQQTERFAFLSSTTTVFGFVLRTFRKTISESICSVLSCKREQIDGFGKTPPLLPIIAFEQKARANMPRSLPCDLVATGLPLSTSPPDMYTQQGLL